MTVDAAVKFCRRTPTAHVPRAHVPRARLRRATVERLESRALCDAAAAAFDPALAAWFRADAITAAPGAALTAWPDSSGHGFTATQADAAHAPHFIPTGLEGRP